MYRTLVAKARKRHVQQQIRWANSAGDLRGTKREAGTGRGKRRRGRPRKPGSGEAHKKRAAFKASQPVHVTLRAVDRVGRLRTRGVYQAMQRALVVLFAHETCRVVHLSIQHNHVHLLVEAENRLALARGMQALQISAAKHINAEISTGRSQTASWYAARTRGARSATDPAAASGSTLPAKRRRGTVFPDRYHAEIIKTPRQARNALAYVLNNWRKHREDRAGAARAWRIDPFSSAWCFDGWAERADEPFVWKLRASYEPMTTWLPRTWLLSEGWRRYGLVSVNEVPSSRSRA